MPSAVGSKTRCLAGLQSKCAIRCVSARMALYYTQQAKKSKLTDAAMTAWEQADERAEAA